MGGIVTRLLASSVKSADVGPSVGHTIGDVAKGWIAASVGVVLIGGVALLTVS